MSVNLTFVPCGSFVDIGFWSEINRRKLNEWKLDESPKSCKAAFSIYDLVGNECRLNFSHESFDSDSSGLPGTVLLFNTIEAFKALPKGEFIKQQGNKIWGSITSGNWLEDPMSLQNFSLTLFADLKKFHYYYWLCTPAVLNFPRDLKAQINSCNGLDKEALLKYYEESQQTIFIIDGSTFHPLSALKSFATMNDKKIVFADSSPVPDHPGWALRNLIAAVAAFRCDTQSATFISLKGQHALQEFVVSWSPSAVPTDIEFTGWEPSAQGKMAPRVVDMKKQFDPKQLMKQSVALNLSLIKWRLVPELQLDRFENLKVLIFGAGTLGCNLARNLMAYNVQTITFIDNSTVSYSNPVRQSLSKFEDARLSRGKAETAAEALKEIYPSIDAQAIHLTVPMPGHPISANQEEQLKAEIERLEDLVSKHDVLFLALDSREARWLPTVIANKYKKMAFSVALGFDNYVVIRHGLSGDEACWDNEEKPQLTPGSLVPYSELACYFCSDVTAPGNSMGDRTLDQQCTVSRPGLSPVAAGIAVELMASVLQHRDPRGASANIGEPDDSSSLLGATPHQIRGFMYKFQQITPCVRRFQKCVACGEAVCKRFEEEGWEFVKQVLNSPSELERVSGLDSLQLSVDDVQIDFSDNDSVMSL
ncbi:unnamed protein product [Auanema sp. JU1783]|nr:unnamed protein product [Auanema sp. JU1783]